MKKSIVIILIIMAIINIGLVSFVVVTHYRGHHDREDFIEEKIEAIKEKIENGEITESEAAVYLDKIYDKEDFVTKEEKIDHIEQMLEAGKISEEKADAWIEAIESDKFHDFRGYHRKGKFFKGCGIED